MADAKKLGNLKAAVRKNAGERIIRNRPQINLTPAEVLELITEIGKGEDFEGEDFTIAKDREPQYYALALYFTGNPAFNELKPGNDLTRGLMLQGTVGTGKTLALRLFVELATRLKMGNYLGGLPRLVSTNAVCDELEALGIWQTRKYVNYNWYCFDDLGDEPLEVQQPYKSLKFEAFRRILGDRYDKFKSTGQITIASTNLNFALMGKYYGVRIESRAKEMFNVISFTGEDKRAAKTAKAVKESEA